MKVIVCGSRAWNSEWCRTLVYNELDRLARQSREAIVVIHGACPKGADRFASEWVSRPSNGEEVTYPADWDNHGKKAGFIRNQAMADDGADLVLAFWDGSSKGTEHMIKVATQAGILVRIIPAPRYLVPPKVDSTSSST